MISTKLIAYTFIGGEELKTHCRIIGCVAVMVLLAETASGTGILTGPNSTYTFAGVMGGSEEGESIVNDSFSSPIVQESTSLPFSETASLSTDGAYATSEYFIAIISDSLPSSDSLELKLNLGVRGNADGAWQISGSYTTDLDGSLTAIFEMQDWSATELSMSMLWFLDEFGDSSEGSAASNINTIRIRGPLDTDSTNQKGFIFDRFLEIPNNLSEESSISMQEIVNLVAGTYLVEFDCELSAQGYNAGGLTTSFGIDMFNTVNVWAQNTIDPTACLPGVPCPTLADIDGLNGVDARDFHLWYQNPVDVTNDGFSYSSDEAAMANLLGLDMVDADGNGIVDGLEPSAVTPGAAASRAVQLHPAYPNPFNPMTVLSFTLPSAEAVDLTVYDVQGHRVRTLLSGATHTEGRHEVTWNGRDDFGLATPAGVYFYRLSTGQGVLTGRMLLLK
jgi:hypothetical protein